MTEAGFQQIFGVAVDQNGHVLDPKRATTYEKRHPTLEGQFLKEKFAEDYVVNTSARCFPFAADGATKLFDQHECNAAESMFLRLPARAHGPWQTYI